MESDDIERWSTYKYTTQVPEAPPGPENDTRCASMATITHPLIDLPTQKCLGRETRSAPPAVSLLFSFIVTVAKCFGIQGGAKTAVGLDGSGERLRIRRALTVL